MEIALHLKQSQEWSPIFPPQDGELCIVQRRIGLPSKGLLCWQNEGCQRCQWFFDSICISNTSWNWSWQMATFSPSSLSGGHSYKAFNFCPDRICKKICFWVGWILKDFSWFFMWLGNSQGKMCNCREKLRIFFDWGNWRIYFDCGVPKTPGIRRAGDKQYKKKVSYAKKYIFLTKKRSWIYFWFCLQRISHTDTYWSLE